MLFFGPTRGQRPASYYRLTQVVSRVHCRYVVACVPPNFYFLEVRFFRQDSKILFRYDSCALVIEIHNCLCLELLHFTFFKG